MALTKTPIELSSTPSIVDGGNATAITIDSSENVGIGQAPSTFSNWKILEIKGGTAGAMLNFENSASTRVSALAYDDGNDSLRIQNFLANPITFETNGSERMRIDASGNVGIGAAPSAWWSDLTAVENHASSGGAFASAAVNGHFLTNAYYDGSNWKYRVNGTANWYYHSGGAHSWHNAASGSAGANLTFQERMRIDASGNLLVGTTTVAPNSTTTIKGSLGLVGPSGVSTSSITFNNPSNVKYWGIATDQTNFYITDADFTHYGYVGQSMTAWTFGSDRRLKENIVDVPYGLNAVMAMQPRAFKFKSSGVETIGFVAQELQEVVPEAVSGTEVEYLDTDTPQEKANKSLGVSQDTLIPVLVKAMQEQQATIESQATAITDLTTRLTALENN